jgi:hypothetical protein
LRLATCSMRDEQIDRCGLTFGIGISMTH